jgi:hypothetical protein
MILTRTSPGPGGSTVTMVTSRGFLLSHAMAAFASMGLPVHGVGWGGGWSEQAHRGLVGCQRHRCFVCSPSARCPMQWLPWPRWACLVKGITSGVVVGEGGGRVHESCTHVVEVECVCVCVCVCGWGLQGTYSCPWFLLSHAMAAFASMGLPAEVEEHGGGGGGREMRKEKGF